MERLLEWYIRAAGELAALRRRLAERLPPPGASQRGSGILEYCLIAAVIAIGLIVVLSQFTTALGGVFTRIIGRLGALG